MSCGCHVDVVLVSCVGATFGCHVGDVSLWMLHMGIMLVLMCESFGCCVGVVWVSFGCEVIKNDVSSVNS